MGFILRMCYFIAIFAHREVLNKTLKNTLEADYAITCMTRLPKARDC